MTQAPSLCPARACARPAGPSYPPVEHGPPTAISSSIPESSEQLAPLCPQDESAGLGCATTWPAARRHKALRVSLPGLAGRKDGWSLLDGRARSESGFAPAMIDWTLSLGLIDSRWMHVAVKHNSHRERATGSPSLTRVSRPPIKGLFLDGPVGIIR